jgi:hypothetical protein
MRRISSEKITGRERAGGVRTPFMEVIHGMLQDSVEFSSEVPTVKPGYRIYYSRLVVVRRVE